MHGSDPTLANLPSRYLSALMVREFLEFVRMVVYAYNLDVDEMLIITCVVAESTRDLLDEAYVSNYYGFEQRSFPDAERNVISLRAIYTTLRMSRETVRRKLARIVDVGLLEKVRGGYFFPAQVGDKDRTLDIRRALVKSASKIVEGYRRVEEE
ncbi:MAG: hypothetical protein RLZZ08_296 [Pseudomonadota bacterium]|jgi:hypothetical protein